MKRVSLNLVGLFIMSLLIASCSSENTILGQFSKRKYLKKVKDKNIQFEIHTYLWAKDATFDTRTNMHV